MSLTQFKQKAISKYSAEKQKIERMYKAELEKLEQKHEKTMSTIKALEGLDIDDIEGLENLVEMLKGKKSQPKIRPATMVKKRPGKRVKGTADKLREAISAYEIDEEFTTIELADLAELPRHKVSPALVSLSTDGVHAINTGKKVARDENSHYKVNVWRRAK